MYLNVNGLLNNYNKIEMLATHEKPWMIMMSETHLTKEIENSEVNIAGYKLIRCDSHSTKTGGVAIYIKNRVKFSIVNSDIYRKNVWTLTLNVNCKQLNGNFAILYHSPSQIVVKYEEFLDYFESWCENKIDHSHKNIICGDFNIDLLKTTGNGERIKRIIHNSGMKQLVTKPTRITNRTRTLIDYVISNVDNINVKVLLNDKISDHSTINFEVKNEVIKRENKITKLCGYTKEKFIDKLSKIEWSASIDLNVNEKADFLTDNLKLCISDFVKTVTIKEDSKVWYTAELHRQKQETGDAYKKAYFSNNEQDWIEYNQASKMYAMNVKHAKNQYYHDRLFNAGNDQRKVWKILKSIINGVNETSESIDFNSEIKTNEVDISESFNRFFIDSIKELRDSIPNEIDQCLITPFIKYDCNFDIVSVDKIESFLNNVKSKGDSEFLSKRVLLDALPVVGLVFADVVNSSMSSEMEKINGVTNPKSARNCEV